MHITNRNSELRSSMENGQSTGAQGGGKSDIAVFSVDRQGNFLACNQAFTQLVGYESPELAGVKFTAMCSVEDRKQADATILSLVSGQGHYQSELHAKPKSGETFKVNFSMTPMNGGGSTPVGFVALVTPVGDRAISATIEFEAESASTDNSRPSSRVIDVRQFILANPVMHKFMGLVDRVAGHTETVLITGETGTGKELIARTIHESPPNRARPSLDTNSTPLP